MDGPTLMMAPVLETNVPFHRSHSSPDLLSSLAKPSSSISSLSDHRHRSLNLKSLPSLPAFDVPAFDLEFDPEFQATLRQSARAKALRDLADDSAPDTRRETKTSKTVIVAKTASLESPDQPERPLRVSRTRSMIDRPRSWLPSSKSTPNVRESIEGPALASSRGDGTQSDAKSAPRTVERSRAVDSFAEFARRSWISPSRSPSPPSKSSSDTMAGGGDGEDQSVTLGTTKTRSAHKHPRKRSGSNLESPASRSTDSLSSTSRALNRASVYLTKIKQRPQSVFVRSTSSLSISTSSSSKVSDSTESPQASASRDGGVLFPPSDPLSSRLKNITNDTSLPRTSSQTTSSSASTATNSSSESASQTTSTTADTTTTTMPHPTSNDPLWSAFRELDAHFARFAAKTSTAARMAFMRATLLPFLQNTAHHSSNKDTALLVPEDVDRRATILNKWWNGLLEVLDGQAKLGFSMSTSLSIGTPATMVPPLQPVAGVDRPTLLECITMIMMRPEWRLCTTYFQSLADRSPGERVRARSWTLGSAGANELDAPNSALLAESAEHNVRTMFVTNLVTQMAVVVEKMSQKHAPLSLVSFGGKACAYAFFFAPGVAEALVRLWGLHSDILRRMADEIKLPRRSRGESDDIVALFPPNLGALGWTSVKTTAEKLRRPAKLPLLAGKIPWNGPWVSRWRGSDTDLFFIFCKYFFILADQFMPPGLPLIETARAPAFVLVHAQLLAILDNTIHRYSVLQATAQAAGFPVSELVQGADAALMALPPNLPANNFFKGMEENRMIILLKDMLSDMSVGVLPGARHTFAEAFMAVTQAATRRTSRYEYADCFMLCDFLDELLTVFYEYSRQTSCTPSATPTEEDESLDMSSQRVDYIDWSFWIDVWKMMLNSNSSLCEVRILSLLFSIWDPLAAEPTRKEAVCLDWLLEPETFDKFFNNYNPMVRAYFMRLICWRICRDPGCANELDTRIFVTVSKRLGTVWSHYLWLKQTADLSGKFPPTTAPCLPTPGRRFLIVRTEVSPAAQPGLLVNFDSFSSPFTNPGRPTSRAASPDSVDGTPTRSKSESSLTAYRKKWSLIGKVLSFTSGTTMGPTSLGSGSPRHTWDDDLDQARRELAATRATKSSQHPFQQPGPPPPPKQSSSSATIASDSDSSTGSSPVFDAIQYIFKFVLGYPSSNGPPRERILTRPRLPAPAQARVSSARKKELEETGWDDQFRSDSPPPPAAGLPPATRRVSGLPQTGLVSEARNADPRYDEGGDSTSPAGTRNSSARNSFNGSLSDRSYQPPAAMDTPGGMYPGERQTPPPPEATPHPRGEYGWLQDEDGAERGRNRSPVQLARPTGIYAAGATYTGRALAEWSIVINECNSFIDRRRDEGVLGLADVEVPALGVEGLRRAT